MIAVKKFSEEDGEGYLVPSDNQTYACVLKINPRVVFCAEMFELAAEPCQHTIVTKENNQQYYSKEYLLILINVM